MIIKILVIEDKPSLNQSIVRMLQKEGFSSLGVRDLKSAKKAFLEEEPNIILLDIMLTDGNSFDLIPFFRKSSECIIIILTALEDEQSKRIAYENGADDYITKPFDLYELLYKLNAIKRRILSQLQEFEIGDITFNLENNSLTCQNKTITIQPSQTRFLKMLYAKYMEDGYVDKAVAVNWISGDVDESPRVQTLVARLRKNLSYVGSSQIYIETIYGKGYKLIVESKE